MLQTGDVVGAGCSTYDRSVTSTSGTPRARSLGAAMRSAREARSVSMRNLARQIGYSHVTVGTWETGEAVPKDVQIAAYLGALGVVGDEREAIERLATNAVDPNWLVPGPEHLRPVLEYERTANSIYQWSPDLMPGLLQTEETARAVLAYGRTQAETEALVTMRVGRGLILTRHQPTEGVFVIGEAALHQRIGGPAVMSRQAQHLIDMSHRDNVTIRILPFGEEWHPGLEGGFVLYRFQDMDPIVYVEHYRSAAFPGEPRDVADYLAAADTILASALDAEASRTRLERLVRRTHDECAPLAQK